MNANDLNLLQQYAQEGSEEAFTAIVNRHLGLVYSAALRQVRSPQLAEEVAQSVFSDLARSARKLKPDTLLGAWLYQVTRRTAVDVVRRESRRQFREQVALEIAGMNSNTSDWAKVEPMLDEAMEALEEADRQAILLRYFEHKSLREVGQFLGASEDAAQKRVSRAVDELRRFFSKRGAAVGVPALVLLLSANAVQSAPAGLSSTISAAAISAGTALHTTATVGTTKAVFMTALQKTVLATVLAAAVGTGVYEARRASQLRQQVQALQQQEAPLAEDLESARLELEAANGKLAAARQENEQLRQGAAEVPRLRGELGRLHQEAREAALARGTSSTAGTDPALEAAFQTWAARASQLKQRLEQMPDKRIPEFQFLKQQDWFDAVKNANKLETDDDFRQALRDLRSNAKNDFARILQQGLKAYTQASGGQLPTDLSQLKPYFPTAVDDAVLQRYSLLQSGNLNALTGGEYLVAETGAPVDDQYDTNFKVSINGISTSSVNFTEQAIEEACIQFAQAHNGVLPTDPSQLEPYLKQPVDPAQVQKLLSKVPPGITTLEQLKAAGLGPR